jgi:peptide/nickel transport system ATP-binding protein
MTYPLLETNSLSRNFVVKSAVFGKHHILRAVDDVNLSLKAGESLGLAGESGCGKSTLARLLIGLIPPSGGNISYRGTPLADMGKQERFAFRKDVQMIFQDPFSSLNPRMRVGEIIGEPLTIHQHVSPASKRDTILDLMKKVGLSQEHYARYPHEFSGGQRQRIGIARALAVSPRVIIADEPVSALDLSIQAQIINLMQELQREYGLSYLFIAHDLSVVRHMSDRIAIMYLGRIVEIGERHAVFSNFLHPYTEALIAAIPRVTPGGPTEKAVLQGDIPSLLVPPTGCPFHTRCPYAELPICATVPPPLEEKEPDHFCSCHFSLKLFRRAPFS